MDYKAEAERICDDRDADAVRKLLVEVHELKRTQCELKASRDQLGKQMDEIATAYNRMRDALRQIEKMGGYQAGIASAALLEK